MCRFEVRGDRFAGTGQQNDWVACDDDSTSDAGCRVAFIGVGLLIGGIVVADHGRSVLLTVVGVLLGVVGLTGWILVVLWPAILEGRRRSTNRIIIGTGSRGFHEVLRESGDSDAPAWTDLDAGVEVAVTRNPRRAVITAVIGMVTVAFTIWLTVRPYQSAELLMIGGLGQQPSAVAQVTVSYTDAAGTPRRHISSHLGAPPAVGSIHRIKFDPQHPDCRGTTFVLIRGESS